MRRNARKRWKQPDKTFGIKPRHRTPRACRQSSRRREIRLNYSPVLAVGRVVFLVQRFLRPGAVGEIRRRRLVAGRRLGQRFPRRLALERGGLRLVAAEQAAEAAADSRAATGSGSDCCSWCPAAPDRCPCATVAAVLPAGEFGSASGCGPAVARILLSFLRAASAALRRCTSGSFGHSAPSLRPRSPAGGGRSAWGGPPAANARGIRCRGFPCWCRRYRA